MAREGNDAITEAAPTGAPPAPEPPLARGAPVERIPAEEMAELDAARAMGREIQQQQAAAAERATKAAGIVEYLHARLCARHGIGARDTVAADGTITRDGAQ